MHLLDLNWVPEADEPIIRPRKPVLLRCTGYKLLDDTCL